MRTTTLFRVRRSGALLSVVLTLVLSAACSTVPVETDPSKAPSFASSIIWLNDYFRANDIAVRVAEDRIHYVEKRANSNGMSKQRFPWYRRTQRVHFQYVNGSILFLGRVTVFTRFDVDDDTEAQNVIQRLVASGFKFNQAARIRSFGCTAGKTESCPKYPDDGANRSVDPATAPCTTKTCRSPR